MPTHFWLYDLACTPNLSNFGRIIIPKGQQQKKGDNAKKLPKSSWPFIFIVILSHFKKSHPPLTQSLQSSTDSTTPAHTTFICRPNDQQLGWFKVIMSFYIFWIHPSLRIYSEGFQGFFEIPWKFLEILNHSTLALICNSLEICTLVFALKFKVFQGQLHFPLEIFQLPSTLKNLEIFWTGHLDIDWTLNFKVNFKEPWNSRPWLSSLNNSFRRWILTV